MRGVAGGWEWLVNVCSKIVEEINQQHGTGESLEISDSCLEIVVSRAAAEIPTQNTNNNERSPKEKEPPKG